MKIYNPINIANNNSFFLKLNALINNYKYLLISFIFISIFFNLKAQNFFLNNQLSFERVKDSYHEKDELLRNEFKEKNLSYPPQNILFMSFKAEGELQVWVKENESEFYVLFKVYDVCQKSGDFGPKRKQGDKQVPEGIYTINAFNPMSDYYLSLGISYPNLSDIKKSENLELGGDIYIHGSCVTVGCLPMTDEKMKEIYLLSILAKNEGQENIPIYLYPFKFNKLTEYIFYKEYPEHISFWENLKDEYYYFKENNKIRRFEIDAFGNYKFYN